MFDVEAAVPAAGPCDVLQMSQAIRLPLQSGKRTRPACGRRCPVIANFSEGN